jgi:serine/threonine-protein kinase
MNESERRIAFLFSQALKRSGAARDEFLSNLGDSDLERDLQSLLSAHERPGRFDELMEELSGPGVRRIFRLQPGEPIARYRIIREIGHGGAATVYLAYDPKQDRRVAIKVLRREVAAVVGSQRFAREIEIASNLTHPHVLPLFESGEADGLLFYVMPYMEGESLRQRLEQEGPLPLEATIRIAEQVCSALSYAHEQGLVHRDIKPENILLTGDQAVVADFGIGRAVAEAAEDRLTGTGAAIGTPAYMSPEQARGSGAADGRMDVYALGCVVYEMMGGRPPFSGRPVRGAWRETNPPGLRTIDPAIPVFVDRAVQRALARHPDDRFRTPTEFATALSTGRVVARMGRRQRTRLLASVAGGVALLMAGALVPKVAERSGVDRIAVLPPANLTNEEEFLVQGVHEALISELAQLDIPVIARATMSRFGNSSGSVREIARELGVDKVVETSLYRQGDSLEITARLYDADNDQEVWQGKYDGDLPNVIALYRGFAGAIADEIGVLLGPEDRERYRRASSMDPAVYEGYLRGMHLLNQSTAEAFSRALHFFHEAVEANPADPLAYTGLAFAYITLAHGPAPPPDALHSARAAAERAVRLDPDLPEAWAALADIRTYLLWDWDGAEEAFTRANALNPSMAMNHYHYAWYLSLFGRAEEAIAAHELARELDPFTPLHTVWLPNLYHVLQQYERGLGEARRVAQEYPDNAIAQVVLGFSAAELGEYDEAISASRKAAEINPAWKFVLGHSYALAGRTEEAVAVLAELERSPPSAWTALTLAMVHTSLGRCDEAFRWLAFEPAHAALPWVAVMPEFAPLREDSRFDDLLHRLNMAGRSEFIPPRDSRTSRASRRCSP